MQNIYFKCHQLSSKTLTFFTQNTFYITNAAFQRYDDKINRQYKIGHGQFIKSILDELAGSKARWLNTITRISFLLYLIVYKLGIVSSGYLTKCSKITFIIQEMFDTPRN